MERVCIGLLLDFGFTFFRGIAVGGSHVWRHAAELAVRSRIPGAGTTGRLWNDTTGRADRERGHAWSVKRLERSGDPPSLTSVPRCRIIRSQAFEWTTPQWAG